MLKPVELVPLSDFERELFEETIPPDHFLRRLLQVVDFEAFRAVLSEPYCSGQGRPALDPVFLLKLEILGYHYKLSDREVITNARFNIAYRWFLGISLRSSLPHHTTMTYFRTRLGSPRLQKVFDALVRQARDLGLVKDRLRLKDATHIIANIAIPSTIRLVAQVRDQLFDALRPFAAARVQEEEQRADALHRATQDSGDDDQLVRRVAHLRSVLAWADEVPAQPEFPQGTAQQQERLRDALRLAHKVLADREDPESGDKLRSIHDPDARCGYHGGYFDGYLLDVSLDADSHIITALNVLPANGDEGADAAALIAHEEQAHGNDVAAVSIDSAGYRGTVLRALTDPSGLHLEVFVPPCPPAASPGFGPEQFTLSADQTTLTCPAGQTTTKRDRSRHDTGWKFRFAEACCAACPLRSQCVTKPHAKRRAVIKNDYEAEYRAAQAQAQTPAYTQVRREHPAIERKLAEIVGRHGGRRARYRGRLRVLCQSLLTGLVVNMKRMVRLLFALPEAGTGTVRAALAGG
jgi:transposase